MERQEKDIIKIRQLLSDAESMWKDLPHLADIKRSTNDTLEGIAALQRNVTDIMEKGKLKYFLCYQDFNSKELFP